MITFKLIKRKLKVLLGIEPNHIKKWFDMEYHGQTRWTYFLPVKTYDTYVFEIQCNYKNTPIISSNTKLNITFFSANLMLVEFMNDIDDAYIFFEYTPDINYTRNSKIDILLS